MQDKAILAAAPENFPVTNEGSLEARSLIEKVLALNVSEELREELEEYKTDIEDGELRKMDLRYLKNLHSRLTK